MLNGEYQVFRRDLTDGTIDLVSATPTSDPGEGWSYLPFQVYANSVFNDTVGQAYVSDTPLAKGQQVRITRIDGLTVTVTPDRADARTPTS